MKRWGTAVKNLIAGALIGGGAILPGVSGGVLAVAFGVYRPLMELLAHPVKAIGKHWKLFVPVGIGAAVGFILFSFLASAFFENAAAPATCLFVGLVAGTLPGLYRRANEAPDPDEPAAVPPSAADVQKDRRNAWIAGVCAFLLLAGILLTLELLPQGATIQPNLFWFLVCGLVWGLSLIVPGLSSSLILIFLGLYQPMAKGISHLDFGVILPVIVGIAAAAIALGRFADAMFRRHYRVCSFAVMGLVVASTVFIIPLQYDGWLSGGLCLLLAVAGFFAAVWMDRLSAKMERPEA